MKQKLFTEKKVNSRLSFFLFIITAIFLLTEALAGAEPSVPQHGWSYSSTVDFAYYPKSDYISGATHFAVPTGFYKKIETRGTFHATYTIPIPFGSNPLFSGNTIVFDTACSLSPVSFMPALSVSFTPIAFFTFAAGTQIGTGWEAAGIKGIARYDHDSRTYKHLDAFSTWVCRYWLSSTFKFDTAALFPGDWNHIVAVASYELNHTSLAGADSDIWEWQGIGNQADGWQYYTTYILGYQMPMAVSFTGILLELYGHMDSNDYANSYSDFNGDFMTENISSLVQFELTGNDTLFFITGFSSRRSFKESHTKTEQEPFLTYSGREWFFNRLAISWTHRF